MAAEPPGMTDRLLDAMADSAARRHGAAPLAVWEPLLRSYFR